MRPVPTSGCTARVLMVIGGALLLGSPRATPESQVAATVRERAPRASAHVDFKIMIPPALALDLSEVSTASGRLGVALFGNARTLILAASVPGELHSTHASVLTAPAHGIIRAVASCAPRVDALEVLCTASMP